MNAILHRILANKKALLGGIVIVLLLAAVLILSTGLIPGVQPIFARLSGPTSGQTAAAGGGNLILGEYTPDVMYFPLVQRH